MSSISSQLWPDLQLDPETAKALARFARRRRALLLLRTAAVGIVSLVATMVIVALFDYLWLLNDATRWLLSLAGYIATFTAMWRFGLRGFSIDDPQQIARQIESAAPRLREDLLSAVELADPDLANGSEGFRQRLQRSVARRAALLDIGRLLPVGLVQRWLLTGSLVMVACFVLLLIPNVQFGRRIARAMLPGAPIQRASLTELTILKPSPPSGYVAEGDAVGVVVRVGGATADEVMIQWRGDDGIEGESIMSPRVQSSAEDYSGTLPMDNVYAANLSVGTTPVEYRVIAGDAITLWHELVPLPRPRAEMFSKRYIFPSYARLPDRVEEAEHGDVRAIVGTLAEVTVRFDEPVYDATVRFGNRGAAITLEPVEGSESDFLVPIPIKTPGTYQVDAFSARSGLNNPFSPQFSITPVIDTPPTVSWSESTNRTMIVSPIDVVSFQATAIDDLPMERVVQEYQVNDEPVVRRNIDVGQPSRELRVNWDWDLLHREGPAESSTKLLGGDIIRTRLVAIDRRGQRGESPFIELLIAEEGFDTERHDRLHQLRELTSGLAAWAGRCDELMKQMKKALEQDNQGPFDDARATAKELHAEQETLSTQIREAVQTSQSIHQAGELELCGRAVLDLDRRMRLWFAQHQFLSQEHHQAWGANRKRALQNLTGESSKLAQSALRIKEYAQAIFGEQLTVGIVSDAMSLRRSFAPLLNEESPMPADRYPRYLTVALERMAEITELIDRHEAALPESTRRHLENWTRWSDSWHDRLKDATKLADKPNERLSRMKDFDRELGETISHGMIDGRLASTVINRVREIRNQIGAASDLHKDFSNEAERAIKLLDQAEGAGNSDEVAKLTGDSQHAAERAGLMNPLLLERLEKEEELHRSRPSVDLQYAADLNLMHRAVTNVTKDGYLPYREEPAASVHKHLYDAFRLLEAKHEADTWLSELRALMLAERRLEENAITKIKHPTWLERFSAGLEWPVHSLRSAPVERSLVDRVDRTRYSEDFHQAKQRVTLRRWSGDPLLTAEIELDALQLELRAALQALEPAAMEARQTIERYVLSLAEQARQAAEQARKAKQRTESRDDSTQETAEDLSEQQEQVAEATRETLESLVDLANTAQITDESQRQLARDADAAAAQVQAAADRAEREMEQATAAESDDKRSEALDETAEALEGLAESLERTAEHFERAENGEDLTESRNELRAAEEAIQFENELAEQYDRSAALAGAMESSPQEMMERLERELQQNEPMQRELSDIAERAAENAQRSLEKAAEDEANLNKRLESADAVYQEQKRRASQQLRNLGRRASTVDNALLRATERALGWANETEIRPKLDEARESLREAERRANELGGDTALLSEMRQAAADMNQSLEKAKAALDEINAQANAVQDEDIHKDESSRKRAQTELERFAQEARNTRMRVATNDKQDWERAKRDAGRRVQSAQRDKRNAENRKRQAEQKVKRDPKLADALQPQIETEQKRIDDAQSLEQAAKATQSFADQQSKRVDQRTKELKNRKLQPLKKPNPAAQLAVDMTDQANDELDSIGEDLKSLLEETDFGDQLQIPESRAEGLANDQRMIAESVADAGEQLRRAARHEQRLGQEELAAQLNAAADAVDQDALEAAREAGESLSQTSENGQQSPEANRKVGEATEQIGQTAQRLAELLAEIAPPDDAEALAAQQSEPTAAEMRGQQLAQTLDELDRAMSQSPSEAESAQANQGQPGQQQGQPGQQQGQPSQQQNAGEASPTLANAMDSQAQQAARRRQQQMNPNGQGQQAGQPSSRTASSRDSQTEGGSGQMPGGGFVDTMGISREGSDWGQLRERRTEDATESRGATIAPEYRREIEAYFRAIARRAAEIEESK